MLSSHPPNVSPPGIVGLGGFGRLGRPIRYEGLSPIHPCFLIVHSRRHTHVTLVLAFLGMLPLYSWSSPLCGTPVAPWASATNTRGGREAGHIGAMISIVPILQRVRLGRVLGVIRDGVVKNYCSGLGNPPFITVSDSSSVSLDIK